MSDETSARILHGRLVGITGQAYVADVEVWLATKTTAGESSTLETITDEEGFFSFDLPTEPLHAAELGAVLLGVQPLDLEPNGQPLEPGKIMLLVDDFAPSHLKYAGQRGLCRHRTLRNGLFWRGLPVQIGVEGPLSK